VEGVKRSNYLLEVTPGYTNRLRQSSEMSILRSAHYLWKHLFLEYSWSLIYYDCPL